MHKALHTSALLLVLAAQTTDSSCQDTSGTPSYGCHVSERGLQVENGYVTDVVRNWCEVGLAPQRQTFITWIETRRNPDDRWLVSGRSSPSDDVPDSDGVTHVLRDGRCQHDIEYGMAWHASGADRNGVPFDTGIVRRLPGRTYLC